MASRRVSVNYDANGNLLTTGVMTNSWDSANRLIATLKQTATLVNHYDGLGNRVGQTQDGVRIDYVLDVAIGLPEVVYTSKGHNYLHLPGLIMTESDTGEVRYLLSDGLGSVRHVTDEAGTVVAYREYSPYGEPVGESETNYGFTGEWWESEVGLLHLRARWYSPEHGVFLSRDVVEGEPAYQYVRGNVVNWVDPSGFYPDSGCDRRDCKVEVFSVPVGDAPTGSHLFIVHTDMNGNEWTIQGGPTDFPAPDNIRSGFVSHSVGYPNIPPQTREDSTYDFGSIGVSEVDGFDPFGTGRTGGRDSKDINGKVIVAKGPSVCDKKRCLQNVGKNIISANQSYWPFGPNSNSVVYTILKTCGLPLKKPSTAWHPGWGMDILKIPENPYLGWNDEVLLTP